MTLEKAREIIAEIKERKGNPIREPEQLKGEPEEAYKALGLVLAYHNSAIPRNVAEWLAGNRHRYVPSLIGKGWGSGYVKGLSAWARAMVEKRGEGALQVVLNTCSLSNEEMSAKFREEIAENETANALEAGDEVWIHYTCDIGCLRLRIDGNGEILIPTGGGDGSFNAIARKHRKGEGAWLRVRATIKAEDSLAIADYDCGEFEPSETLPPGTYEISTSDGFVEIVKVS